MMHFVDLSVWPKLVDERDTCCVKTDLGLQRQMRLHFRRFVFLYGVSKLYKKAAVYMEHLRHFPSRRRLWNNTGKR